MRPAKARSMAASLSAVSVRFRGVGVNVLRHSRQRQRAVPDWLRPCLMTLYFTWSEALREFLLHLEATRAKKTFRFYDVQLPQLIGWAEASDVLFMGFGKRHLSKARPSMRQARPSMRQARGGRGEVKH